MSIQVTLDIIAVLVGSIFLMVSLALYRFNLTSKLLVQANNRIGVLEGKIDRLTSAKLERVSIAKEVTDLTIEDGYETQPCMPIADRETVEKYGDWRDWQ